MQKKHILEALGRTQWRITGKKGAAALLNMNGKTLASKMRKLNINREDYLEL
jgi:transcriptional regulator with GAF, ATPase, and Fis domain